ncbi:unnamed protein product [Acanthoscelides obtectus]|uniref:Uncharacterized protein n=1 Tax=Acanthoscelides obtectus TaxID=200917 RepID=A0A9P0NUR2_ACAOB|nr:unnamed protein product [Acanthoscelides obtectus]CAK1658141.1 hypothetical protein AOBTE_LOCUS20721 [Acanthoscelides obtectus]
MERWPGAFIIEAYSKNTRTQVQDKGFVFTSILGKFRETLSALNVKRSGRPRTVTTPDSVEAGRVAINQNPSGSVRKRIAIA